ncbi:hypothetical protein Acr_11g0010150 [Actinidia rufa]|uniref:Uncharacterized protein n=1 Tax=Actinidia rufa TaxID=165716 RepID=A0A7J0FEV4_9ERIC|nr:hypothetical protein Acr_11g0010150 [Actinidia rufa]
MVDVTVADSGERLDIGGHSMEHEVGGLKGRLGEPKGNMLATVNSMELLARIKEYEERQQLEEEPTILEPEDDSTSTKVDRSKETVEVLEDFKDLVSPESPKSLPPKGEVDHSTKLEEGAKILAMTPYHIATPELPKSLLPKREVDHSIRLENRYYQELGSFQGLITDFKVSAALRDDIEGR